MLPVQITLRDIPGSEVLEDHIRQKAMKLTHYYQRINSIRIVVHVPQKHKHQGKLFSVHIDLMVPGKELVVNRKLDEDIYIAIRDAFRALQRQLESYACKKRGDVKIHEAVIRGHVKKLIAAEGYGFIQGEDGTEHYFSMANVSHPDFSQLQKGDLVQFISVPGSDGMQAHRVTKEKSVEF